MTLHGTQDWCLLEMALLCNLRSNYFSTPPIFEKAIAAASEDPLLCRITMPSCFILSLRLKNDLVYKEAYFLYSPMFNFALSERFSKVGICQRHTRCSIRFITPPPLWAFCYNFCLLPVVVKNAYSICQQPTVCA